MDFHPYFGLIISATLAMPSKLNHQLLVIIVGRGCGSVGELRSLSPFDKIGIFLYWQFHRNFRLALQR